MEFDPNDIGPNPQINGREVLIDESSPQQDHLSDLLSCVWRLLTPSLHRSTQEQCLVVVSR